MSTLADETERVEYVFEGDANSLKEASNEAINLLKKYSDSMRRASETDAFKASQRSMQSMNASINKLTKDVEKMQTKLKGVGDVKLPTGSTSYQAMSETLSTVSAQMQKLSSSETVTTNALKDFKAQLDSVRSTLQSTYPQVDKLVASEQRFQNILAATQNKADSFRNAMESIRSRISSTFDPVTSKMRSLSDVFSGVTAKIQSFKDRATTAFSRVSKLASAVASAFRRTSQSTKDADNAAKESSKSHKELSDSVEKLNNNINKNSKVTEVATSKANTFKSSLSGLKSVTNIIGKTFEALTGLKLGDWISQATSQAISFVENLNLFKVAMGDNVEQGLEFIKTMSEIYGMDPSNLYRYTGYFYQLTDAIGMTDTASANLSMSMTKAANDIASLFNADIGTVVENLASGMQGMSRAVRKYGMDIRATTLQQTALKYGLTESVYEMSEANRMALRYLTMMEQVSNATQQLGKDIDGTTITMGDFARTIEEPANQLRIFKEQVTQLGRSIGNFLIVPLKQFISYVNGFIMALRTAINFIASALKILDTSVSTTATEDIAKSIDSIGASADSTAKKLKNLVSPFDELTILQEQSSESSAGAGFEDILDPALEQAIAGMSLNLENIKMKANEVRDALLEFFGFKIDAGEILSWDPSQFEKNLINKFPQWTKTIQAAFDNWSNIIEGFKSLFDSLIGVVTRVKEKVLDFLSIFVNDDTASAFIGNLGGNLQSLADWISGHEDLLANLAITLFVVSKAFSAVGKAATVFKSFEKLGTTFTTISSASSSLGTVVGVLTAIIASIVLLYNTSEQFAESFRTLFSTIGESIAPLSTSLMTMLQTIGEGLLTLWETSVQPTLESIGNALAPVLETLGQLWLDVSEIISSVFSLISDLWTNTLEPVFAALLEGVQSISAIFQSLWEEIIGPIVEYIGSGVSDLWENTLSPIIEKVVSIIGNVVEAALGLWNNVLAPLIDWLIDTLGPSIENILETIWDVVSGVIEDIGGIIDGILTVLDGVTEFLAGLFTGDIDKALKGIKNIFIGLGNTIISIFETALNGVISLINMAISLIYNAVVGLINIILGAVEGIADLLGFDLNLKITAPPKLLARVSFPRIPAAANGGIVTSPTYLLAGEGKYDEAILPLGNSPQMEDLVQRIAKAVEGTSKNDNASDNPIEVHVYIDSQEITSTQNRVNRMYGRTQQNI